MKGYITRYYNAEGCCYDSKVFKTKKEACKKDGAKTISVTVSDWNDIYFGDNFKGWCTNKAIGTFTK